MPVVARKGTKILKKGNKILAINRMGNGLRTDTAGTADFILVNHNASLNVGTGDFSVSMVILMLAPGTDPNSRLIGKFKGDSDGGVGWLTLIDNTTRKITFNVRSSGTDTNAPRITSTTALEYGHLYYVVFNKISQSRANWEIWINGEEDAVTGAGDATVGASIDNDAELVISRLHYRIASGAIKTSGANFGFNGYYYDIKMFNRALDGDEIRALSNSDNKSLTTAKDNVQEHWPFEQKSGTVLNAKNGNTGTLTNFANTSLGASNQWVDKYQQSITS